MPDPGNVAAAATTAATTTTPPTRSATNALAMVRWALPVALFAIAVFFEWSEHLRVEGEAISPTFFTETVIFGLVGPSIVFVTLTWVSRLIGDYVRTSDALAHVNHDLEAAIDLRTQNLRLATAQLEAANAELEEANRDLRQLDRLKSDFVSLVSHQLRAPLTNIRGALEIVGEHAEGLPPATRRPLEILDREAEHLTGLVTKILDVSRLEAGHLSLSLGPVAVEPLLARSCAAALGPSGAAPWSLLVAPGLPPVWADEALLEEVVRNIVHNAAVHAADTGPIEVSATMVAGQIRVAVDDHGPGVPAEEQARILESFHRVGERDSAAHGYGLGLYFADRLIAAMDGALTVTSPLWPDPAAPGTRFAFTLPIAPDAPDDSDADTAA